MADVTLSYKGATIAELNDSGSKTLRTAGKFCEADIGVEYVKPLGGLNYTVRTVSVTKGDGQGVVDRDFENFVLIAQLAQEDFPSTLSNNAAMAMMFAYFNGKYILNGNKGVFFRSKDASTVIAIALDPTKTAVGNTAIQFSAYPSSLMYTGKWNVLQIEIPPDFPIYNINLMLGGNA